MLGYALVAPVVICLLILVVYPFLFGVAISFTNREIGTEGQFVGLANFIYLSRLPSFQKSIVNTLVLVGVVQTMKLEFGLGIALLLNQAIRARQFWRGLILLPWAMPAFVAYLTWKLLYLPQGGAFNVISVGLGFGNIDFLSRELAMPSVILATFWRGFPFWVISFLAALQSVPQEQYEAAAIDGANALQRLFRITLPLLSPVTFFVLVTDTIGALQVFDAPYILTRGGPANATQTAVMYLYGKAFQMQHMGLASAVAYILFVGIMCLTILNFGLGKHWVYYESQ